MAIHRISSGVDRWPPARAHAGASVFLLWLLGVTTYRGVFISHDTQIQGNLYIAVDNRDSPATRTGKCLNAFARDVIFTELSMLRSGLYLPY